MTRLLNEVGRHCSPLTAIRSTLMVATLLATQAALAAWHDQQPGSGVAAHYVRLSGFGGDNVVNNRNLLVTYRACTETQTALGRPFESLPAQGMPAIVSTHEIEIYYSTNRTLTIKQGTLFSIDGKTCALVITPHRFLELRSGAGRCDIDLLKNKAVGNCDASAHAQATGWSGVKQPSASMSAMDLDKVPAQTRVQVRTQLDELRRRSAPTTPDAGSHSTETKEVANTGCQVYRNLTVATELCVANPTPTALNPLAPYPIPAAPLNAGIPGILIAAKTPALTLVAQEVRWNLSVSPDLFNLPTDARNRATPGRQQ